MIGKRILSAAGAATVFLVAGPFVTDPGRVAWAQAGQQVEEIIVTVRRREEKLQRVPIAVNAISSETIVRTGIKQLSDLSALSSSLIVDEVFSQQDVRVAVRGLSNTRGRSNVAFLVDGIDVTSETTGTSAGSSLLANLRLLSDVERIETVKGPQSALYGRAAFAGAINYITKEPGEKFEGRVSVEVGEDGIFEASAGIGGPVIEDVLGLRLDVVSWEEDGHYENVVSGAGFGGGEGLGAALTALWTPAETFRAKARVSYTDDEYAPRSVIRLNQFITVPVPAAANVDPDPFFGPPFLDMTPTRAVTSTTSVTLPTSFGSGQGQPVRASEDVRTGTDHKGSTLQVLRGSLNLEWALDSVTITSLTGFTDANATEDHDNDRQAIGRPDTILANHSINSWSTTEQFSQELRIASNLDGPVQFTLGGLYWMEERAQFDSGVIAACFISPACTAPPPFVDPNNWQEIVQGLSNTTRGPVTADSDHWSIYALAEWDLSDTFKVAAEARYTDEEFIAGRDLGGGCTVLYPILTGCNIVPIQAATVASSFTTPKVTFTWLPTDNAMVYFSAANGQKPGGISLLPTGGFAPPPYETLFFEPEKMWAYELGSKTSWNGGFGTLVFNNAVFFQDYTDKQTATQTIDPNGFLVPRVSNASSAKAVGLELEFAWATPVEGLSLNLGLTLLDTEYEDFIDLTTSAQRIAAAGSCNVVGVLEPSGITQNHCAVDFSGHELEKAPDTSVVGGFYFDRQLANGRTWFLEGHAQYQSERFLDNDNFVIIESFTQVDLRTGLSGEDWDVVIYVDNVLDDDTIRNAGSGPDFGSNVVDGGFGSLGASQWFAVLPPPRVAGVRANFRF
jgi:iron complex outermembrane receptor protein